MKPWLLLPLALLAIGCNRSTAKTPQRHEDARKPLFYRNPMNPQDTSPVPKRDYMGMDYIPVYAEQPAGAPLPSGMSTVQIDATQRRLIGLKTAKAERVSFDPTIRTTGRVAFDEPRVVKVQPRFEGFIEKLYADFTGKYVKKGEPLVSIYSPELLATEQEYCWPSAVESTLAKSGLPDAAEAARDALAAVRHPRVRRSRASRSAAQPERALTLRVAHLRLRHRQERRQAGARVGPNDALFEIVDLSRRLGDGRRLRVRAAAPARSATAATLTLSYWPDSAGRAGSATSCPTVDDKTRTVKVRIELDNPRGELKPEMFGDVVIDGSTARGARGARRRGDRHRHAQAGVRRARRGQARSRARWRPATRAGGRVEVRVGLAEGDAGRDAARTSCSTRSRACSRRSTRIEPPSDGGAAVIKRHHRGVGAQQVPGAGARRHRRSLWRVDVGAHDPARRDARPLRHAGHRLLALGPQPRHHRGSGHLSDRHGAARRAAGQGRSAASPTSASPTST